MIRNVVRLMLGIALAAAPLAPALAQGIPPGSYQQSCSHIHVRGGALIARCNSARAGQTRSSIPLGSCRGGDIANSNGQLVCHGGGGFGRPYADDPRYGAGVPPGSYHQSCRNVQMQGNLLTASCNGAGGGLVRSSIDPRACRGADIANRNGRLSCS